MTTTKKSITFLGLGHMGSAIARALARASYNVIGWNRTQKRPTVDATIADGAVFEGDLVKAVLQNDVIAACVLGHNTLVSLLSGLPDGALAGKTLYNITSCSPREAADMDALARQKGAAVYIDSSIMVTPEMVGTEHSFLVASGATESAFAKFEDFFSPVGKAVYHGPEVSASSRYDIAALSVMYGMLSGGYLAMAILKKGIKKEGEDEIKVAPTMHTIADFLAALVPLIAREAELFDAKAFDDPAGNPLGMVHHGLEKIVQAAREDAIDAGMLAHLEGVMKKAVQERGGDGGSSVLPTYL